MEYSKNYNGQDNFKKSKEMYFLWKELNFFLTDTNERKIPFNRGFIKSLFCEINNFIPSEDMRNIYSTNYKFKINHERINNYGKEPDFINLNNGDRIELKVGSSRGRDMTLISENQFDELHYAQLDEAKDLILLYKVSYEELIQLGFLTQEDPYLKNKRNRFSFTYELINKLSYAPYALIDFQNDDIISFRGWEQL